jgi:chaperone modulatory protein CbpM
MIETREFLLRARLDAATLEVFVTEGWIIRTESYSETDLARACLVRDLRDAMGVNDEGVSVVLDLVDRLHATRAALKRLSTVLQSVPEPVRAEALAALRAAGGEP